MKKLFFPLLITMLILPFAQITASAQEPPIGDDEIIIVEKPLPGDDRAPAPVRAFIEDENISILFVSNIGAASISVLDCLGNIVFFTTADPSLTNTIQFAAPVISGTYTLVVQSSLYYGEGFFIM